MSGLDLCRTLRQRMGSDVRITALTAQTLPEELEEVWRSGFDSVVIKPFREKDLLSELHAAISYFDSRVVEFDLSSILKMSEGDDELFHDNLNVLIEESMKDIHSLKNCLLTLNKPRATEIIHRLAGRIGQAGAKDLFIELRSIENSLRTVTTLEDFSDEIITCSERIKLLIEHIRAASSTSKAINPDHTSR